MNVIKEILFFIDNSNVNPKRNCKRIVIYLNKSGTSKLIENMLFALIKFGYWHNAQVSLNSDIVSEIRNYKRKKISSDNAKNLFKTIRSLRSKYPEYVFIGHLNRNSLQK